MVEAGGSCSCGAPVGSQAVGYYCGIIEGDDRGAWPCCRTWGGEEKGQRVAWGALFLVA